MTIAEIGDHWAIYVLMFGPAVIGFFSLVVGLVLVLGGSKEEGTKPSTGRLVLGALLLTLTLGIGGCYAVMMFGMG